MIYTVEKGDTLGKVAYRFYGTYEKWRLLAEYNELVRPDLVQEGDVIKIPPVQLDKLVYWRLQGTPDVFTETRDGERWTAISHGKPYHAGFFQRVEFDRPIVAARLSVIATLFTTGSLGIRVGMNITGETDPQASNVSWCHWEGPDNGWTGTSPKEVSINLLSFMPRKQVTVFLESKTGDWATTANISWWRDVQLEVVYAEDEPEPEPEPEPDPEPDPDQGIIGEIAQTLGEINQRLERISGLLDAWGKGQAWVDTYNHNRFKEWPP